MNRNRLPCSHLPAKYAALAVLLAAPCLLAQRAPTSLQLPAGELPVALLVQAGEAVLGRIDSSKVAAALATAPALRLQRELVVPAAAAQDLLSGLLASRGLVLACGPQGQGFELFAPPDGEVAWLRERAVDLSLAGLHERPALAGPVRVEVTSAIQLWAVRNHLRLLFVTEPRCAVAVEAGTRGIQLVGLADAVRTAAAWIATIDPWLAADLLPPAATPDPAADGPRFDLPAGNYTKQQLVDALAGALGGNVVLSPMVAADTTPVAVAALVGDRARFAAGVRAVLEQAGVVVLPRWAAHGLHEAVALAPAAWALIGRGQAVAPAELLAAEQPTGLVLVHVAGNLAPPPGLMTTVRRHAQANQGLAVMQTVTGCWVAGDASTLQALLRALEPLATAR